MEEDIKILEEIKQSIDTDYGTGRRKVQAIDNVINKIKELEEENHTLKEKIQMFIPRRRVRRIYKMIGKILRTDIDPVLLEKELKKEE